jgi:hypothetical protein
VEEGPQEVVGGEGDVEVGGIEQIAGDAVDPVVRTYLAAGGAEADFAGRLGRGTRSSYSQPGQA